MNNRSIALSLALSILIPIGAAAKLPPLTDDAKLKAADTAARGAWTDKVAAYKLCLSMDRTAEAYRRNVKASGKEPPAPSTTPPCADPGPYVAITPESQKPLEASGAHSPPGTAQSPPSNPATQAEMSGKK